MGKCHSRECDKRALWTRMARYRYGGLPHMRSINNTRCAASSTSGDVGLRVLPNQNPPLICRVGSTVEHLICNQAVVDSISTLGSRMLRTPYW